ncbi:MAG: hypothetical protein ACTS1Z_09100 [Parasphingopyxis sp.]|uniref:hypothetical protein n=1 Tax=Parasphingopyxis sp. TaxID=1920299 RepID=UPI003FA0E361
MTLTPSKPKLFIHIGQAKTGSSSFQFLIRKSEYPGWLYPQTGQWPDGAHHRLLFAFDGVEKRGNIDIEPFEKQLAALQAEIEKASGSNVILSSELVFGGKNGIEFVKTLQAALGRHFEHTEIVAVYRSHLELASSLYNQQIKDAVCAETRDPDTYLGEIASSLQYAPIIEKWENAGFPVRLLSYHPRATYLDRMTSAFGLEPFEGEIPRRNPSLPPLTTLGILAANRFTENSEELARLSVQIRKNRALKAIPTSGSLLFSVGAADRFELSLKRDREFVKNHGEPDCVQSQYRPEPLRISQDAARQFFDCLAEFDIASNDQEAFRDTMAPYIS